MKVMSASCWKSVSARNDAILTRLALAKPEGRYAKDAAVVAKAEAEVAKAMRRLALTSTQSM